MSTKNSLSAVAFIVMVFLATMTILIGFYRAETLAEYKYTAKEFAMCQAGGASICSVQPDRLFTIAMAGVGALALSPSIYVYLRSKKRPFSAPLSALLYAVALLVIFVVYFSGLWAEPKVIP